MEEIESEQRGSSQNKGTEPERGMKSVEMESRQETQVSGGLSQSGEQSQVFTLAWGACVHPPLHQSAKLEPAQRWHHGAPEPSHECSALPFVLRGC